MADNLGAFAGMANIVDAPQEASSQPVNVRAEDLGAFGGMVAQANVPKASPTPAPGNSYFDSALSTVSDFTQGAKRGVDAVAEGGVQSGLRIANDLGVDTSGAQGRLAALRQERIGEYGQAVERSPVASSIGNLAGGIVAGGAAIGSTALAMPALGSGGLAATASGVLGGAFGNAALTYGNAEERTNAALIGGALGVLPGAVNASGYLANRLMGKGTAARIANAESLGMPITMGQATQNSGLLAAEKSLSEVPVIGTGKMFERQLAGTKQAITDTVENLSGSNITKEQINNAYNKFAILAEQSDVPVNISALKNAVAAKAGNVNIGGVDYGIPNNSKLAALMDKIKNTPENIPATDIQKLQTQFQSVIDRIPKSDASSKRVAVGLKDLFQTDLEVAAKNSGNRDVVEAFVDAKNLYAQKKTGDIASQMLKNSIDPTTNQLSTLNFARQISKNSDKLSKVMNPKDFQMMQGLQKFIQTVNVGNKIGASSATTVRNVIGGALGYLSLSHPLLGAAVATGVKVASKGLTGPSMAGHLMKMANTKAGSSAAKAIASSLLYGVGNAAGQMAAPEK